MTEGDNISQITTITTAAATTTTVPSETISLNHLPNDILFIILDFIMDLPTLSALQTTSKKSLTISQIASDNALWSNLVKRRFNITSRRPKSYGGKTWKDAYRSLSQTNRLPKCRFTAKRKYVFAKTNAHRGRQQQQQQQHEGNDGNRHGASLWVMIGHTEDCQTRRMVHPFGSQRRSRSFDVEEKSEWSENDRDANDDNNSSNNNSNDYYPSFHDDSDDDDGTIATLKNGMRQRLPWATSLRQQQQRCIELHVCIQNTRTSCGCLRVDFRHAFVQFITDTNTTTTNGTTRAHRPLCINVNTISRGPKKPRVLFRSPTRRGHDETTTTATAALTKKISSSREITLHPLDYAIVAVTIPCPSDIIYETDFLSRVTNFCVPVTHSKQITVVNVTKTTKPVVNDDNRKTRGVRLRSGGVCYNDDDWATVSHRVIVSAPFLPENDIWGRYMELPGGCLALVEPDQLAFA